MSAESQRILNQLSDEAAKRFLERNANLLALTKNGPNDVARRISAAIAMDKQLQEGVVFFFDVIAQQGYAGKIAKEDCSKAIYEAICKAFLKIQRNCVVVFATKLTPEALAELEGIEVAAGERQAPPPPPPQKSAQDQLEDQVREDWRKLPTDKLKTKMNRDPEYRQTFDRLMAANQLESQCTSLHDGGAEFRQ